jgi:hypothetical protein
MRALSLSALCVMDGCIVHVNTQNRGGKKNPLTQRKKREENKKKRARHEMLAARDALAFTSILFDFHRVLRVLILMCATC